MIKLDIYAGLLGAGKTTLIKKMLEEVYIGSKVAVIENEFGSVNLDSVEFESSGYIVKEISSGCICCTLKGNLTEAIRELAEYEDLDYIIVEPSGIADLKDVVSACVDSGVIEECRRITVVNGLTFEKLQSVVGDFFRKQICDSSTVYLNFADRISEEKIDPIIDVLLRWNSNLKIVLTPLTEIVKETFPENEIEMFQKPKILKKQNLGKCKIKRYLKPEFQNWQYTFSESLDKNAYLSLLSLFNDEKDSLLWRAKGYLILKNGTVKKLDYSMGKVFTEEKISVKIVKANTLTLIGTDFDKEKWKKYFESIVDRMKTGGNYDEYC